MPTLPPEFWTNEANLLREVLLPELRRLAIAGASATTASLRASGIWLDDSLANAEAAAWARAHTDDLLNVLGTTNARFVGEAVASWTETKGATVGDLKRVLDEVLTGPARIDATATTEVTRAYTQGNIIAYTSAGAIPPPMWTGPDGITRPYGPPGHVRCRCRAAFKRLGDGTLLIVWLTLRDDIVCKRKFDTPWGPVDGCRAMNGVCISDHGAYGGRRI